MLSLLFAKFIGSFAFFYIFFSITALIYPEQFGKGNRNGKN